MKSFYLISTFSPGLFSRRAFVEITINKWDEYQPRKDRAKHSWFRLNNDIFLSESLFNLTCEEKWFWICLLAYASRKGCAVITHNPEYFEKHFGLQPKKMLEALDKLSICGVLSIKAVTDRSQTVSLHYITLQTNITNNKALVEKSTSSPPITDFESLVQSIPKDRSLIWTTLYDNDIEFMTRETLKAWNYYTTNKRKMPKNRTGWVRALSSWFERAWTYRAKQTPGNKKNEFDEKMNKIFGEKSDDKE